MNTMRPRLEKIYLVDAQEPVVMAWCQEAAVHAGHRDMKGNL